MSDWKRMGAAVRARREALRLTQDQAAARASVGVTTWRQVELGNQQRYRGLTLAAVSQALDWPADACARIAEGEDVDQLMDEQPGDDAGESPSGVPAALSGAWGEMTAEQRRSLLDYAEWLRQQVKRDAQSD